MDYIIFDLEFNQLHKSKDKTLASEKCPFEIIQIGAIKVDSKFNNISTFSALVKPSIYTKIHPFVEKLTNITMKDLMSAKPFNEVFEEFLSFTGNQDNIFVVWGLVDMKEMFRNIKYHKLNDQAISKKYINIQSFASRYFNIPKNQNINLQNAIELLNIPLEKKFHNAFNDAYYTAEIFKKLYNESLEPQTYDPDSERKNSHVIRKPRKIIDINGLIKQFEKMYERKMTDEEISIIKLSYKMGLTHQFQIYKTSKSKSSK